MRKSTRKSAFYDIDCQLYERNCQIYERNCQLYDRDCLLWPLNYLDRIETSFLGKERLYSKIDPKGILVTAQDEFEIAPLLLLRSSMSLAPWPASLPRRL